LFIIPPFRYAREKPPGDHGIIRRVGPVMPGSFSLLDEADLNYRTTIGAITSHGFG
jgi:hypothetical protein